MKSILRPFYKIARAVRRLHELRTMPLRLEFVVTDYCNLNCRGCTHYSPLAAKEFAPIESLRRNMAHLGRVCGTDVESVYLIGGETLLYPDIIAAMEALRESFATQNLYIFTNGLMIPRLDDAFWATAARLDIILAVTRYPIRFDYDAAIALCASKGVRTEVFGDRSMKDSFYRFALDPAKTQNKRRVWYSIVIISDIPGHKACAHGAAYGIGLRAAVPQHLHNALDVVLAAFEPA